MSSVQFSGSFLMTFENCGSQFRDTIERMLKSKGRILEWSFSNDKGLAARDIFQWQVYVKFDEKLPVSGTYFEVEGIVPKIIPNVRPKKRVSNVKESAVPSGMPSERAPMCRKDRKAGLPQSSVKEQVDDLLPLFSSALGQGQDSASELSLLSGLQRRKGKDQEKELQKALAVVVAPLHDEIAKLKLENERLERECKSSELYKAAASREDASEIVSLERIRFLKAQIMQLERQMLEIEQMTQFQDFFFIDMVNLFKRTDAFFKKAQNPLPGDVSEFKALQASLAKLQQNLKTCRLRWNADINYSHKDSSPLALQLARLREQFSPKDSFTRKS